MSDTKYPNESPEYRKARDELLEEEKALVEKVKAVAEKRRQLPPGGKLKEDYVLQRANEGNVGDEVRLSPVFARVFWPLPGYSCHSQAATRPRVAGMLKLKDVPGKFSVWCDPAAAYSHAGRR